MKKYFLPNTDLGLRDWLRNMANKIGDYATKYGITAMEVMDLQASATDFEALLAHADAMASYGQSVTGRKNELRDGVPPGGSPSVIGTMPTIPMLTTAPGIVKRASAIANRIKAHIAYTVADGENLGLEGAVTVFDPSTSMPRISGTQVLPDMVVIEWVKGRMQGVIVERSLDGSTWKEVDKDMRSPWEDTSPNRTAAAEWRHYRLRYLLNDKPVGLYSEVVSLLVSIGVDTDTTPDPKP
ncbi:MAG: hypothetical protein K9J06_09585 [Flavobacteriales bacterium]|nr:hypothetical protein [Flavobacteriales bacterium]